MRPGAEMVDSLGLNPSGDFLRVGSTPTPGTSKKLSEVHSPTVFGCQNQLNMYTVQ